uniref:Uncharacterized protein n=1 Tax=Caenorhabditis japonica TaxID=281687 RepID=A0A8R1HZV3_CAEJA
MLRPRKVLLQAHTINDDNVRNLLAKLKMSRERSVSVALSPVDPKNKILMEKFPKKQYPIKFVRKEKGSTDEAASCFVRSREARIQPAGFDFPLVFQDDEYDHVPKLEDVIKLPDENIFTLGDVPFWAEKQEPDEEDTKDVEPPISVGTEHLELYQDKKLVLISSKENKLTMDEYQPLAALMKRNDSHFQPHLIFSNTIRTLVNVCGKRIEEEGGKETVTRMEESPVNKILRFESGSPIGYVYSVPFLLLTYLVT